MLSQFFDGSQVNIGIALLGGFITFFASCLLPLIPTYLAYLSGVALTKDGGNGNRWLLLRVATSFVLGFITTFVVLGAMLNRFAVLLVPYRLWMTRIAGVIFIILGLFMLEVFKHRWFTQERRFNIDTWIKGKSLWHAFVTGVAFGFGWTPCIGPVLAVILYWSAQQASFWHGLSLLIAYGIGLGIPFLIVAAAFDQVVPWLRRSSRVGRILQIISAVIIIVAGVLMLTGQFQRLSLLLLDVLHLRRFAV